jgi:hypothetical protein
MGRPGAVFLVWFLAAQNCGGIEHCSGQGTQFRAGQVEARVTAPMVAQERLVGAAPFDSHCSVAGNF